MESSRSTEDSREEASPERGVRLDAYLSRAGLTSRKEARQLIAKGQVTVDGEVLRDASHRVRHETIRLRDELVESPVEVASFLLHKPEGYACSHDEREAPLVFDLLEERLRRRALKIAGRLDRATSGLLVLTTDGDLVHRLTHPTRKLPKRYRIEYTGELVSDAAERCAAGVTLEGSDTPTRPSELALDGPGRATLVLREGRTHQVRRMIRALGGRVVGLHRDRVGDFDLPADLEAGALRPLADEERALLLREAFLRDKSL